MLTLLDPGVAGDEIVDLPSATATDAGDAGTEVAWLIMVAAQLPRDAANGVLRPYLRGLSTGRL